ncbi:MAG TPA: STAS domain-containing protein [Spirochaetota bacterium]|nr:STAS domain-containing protein [Spirochaetota bacterium]HOS39286.1 STAS domain-containing protein [Spirochaetota bacterium]HPI21547.1 STAS domain-containing protein [Spirochaetota bacterium]HPU88024.1 STAS domain-containing protein [Spirochaetota bacterium]
MFLVTIDHRGAVPILNLKGDLILDYVEHVDEVWNRVKEGQPQAIALNFKDLEQIDSAGLGSLIRFHYESKDKNIELMLLDPSPEILSLFEVAGIHILFTIVTRAQFEADHPA